MFFWSLVFLWAGLSILLQRFGLKENTSYLVSAITIISIFAFINYDNKKEKNKLKNKEDIDEEEKTEPEFPKMDLMSERETIKMAVIQHAKVLLRKRSQLVYINDYGKKHDEKWKIELVSFMQDIAFPYHNLDFRDVLDRNYFYINNLLDMEEEQYKESERIKSCSDPFEFENLCSKILSEKGYISRATQKSGDQGVDVIAEKDGKTIIVQCKLYHHPVGNSAVQEAIAGREHYKADYGAVVSNSTFTKSAKQLANSCGIYLININDLSDIDSILE